MLITTHSISEAEAIASKMIIMKDGRVQCIGSPQEIIEAMADGLELHVKFRPATLTEIDAYCHTHWKLPSVELLTSQQVETFCSSFDSWRTSSSTESSSSRLTAAFANKSTISSALNRDGFIKAFYLADWFIMENQAEALLQYMIKSFPYALDCGGHGAMRKYKLPRNPHTHTHTHTPTALNTHTPTAFDTHTHTAADIHTHTHTHTKGFQLSDVFSVLDPHRLDTELGFSVEDFTLNQPTVEQIFDDLNPPN